MRHSKAAAGYFRNGLPYNRFGHGPRNLVVFQGSLFENKPLTGLMIPLYVGMYMFLFSNPAYTTYIVTRKPGLPADYTLQNMSDDYAAAIREEIGGPVDVIGVSTGGSIAQHFAAEHPDLVRTLILHSSAYTLNDAAKKDLLRVSQLARQQQWRAVYTAMVSPVFPQSGIMKQVARPIAWLAPLMAWTLFGAPEDPSDLAVTIEAEDKHDFKNRLAQIIAPTLVIAGDKDPYYSEALFRETAEGIPNARLILYKGMGHPVFGRQFQRDVLRFLKEGEEASASSL